MMAEFHEHSNINGLKIIYLKNKFERHIKLVNSMKIFNGTVFLIGGFILLISGSIFFLLKAQPIVWIFMISVGFILMMGSGREDTEEGHKAHSPKALEQF